MQAWEKLRKYTSHMFGLTIAWQIFLKCMHSLVETYKIRWKDPEILSHETGNGAVNAVCYVTCRRRRIS